MKALESRSLYLVYGTMILAGLGLDFFSTGAAWTTLREAAIPGPVLIVTGLLFGALLLSLYRMVSKLCRWRYGLREFLLQNLTPLSYLHAILIGGVSALLEEWFFRGLLAPRLGIILSSLLFAAAHHLPHRQRLSWIFWNFGFSITLGLLAHESHSFWTSTIAHGFFNLSLLIRLNQIAYRSAVS